MICATAEELFFSEENWHPQYTERRWGFCVQSGHWCQCTLQCHPQSLWSHSQTKWWSSGGLLEWFCCVPWNTEATETCASVHANFNIVDPKHPYTESAGAPDCLEDTSITMSFLSVPMPAILFHESCCPTNRHYGNMQASSPSPGPASTAHSKIPKETPRNPWYTSDPSYRSGSLVKAREAVILYVGPISEVSYEFFVNSVMPAPKATSSLDFTKIKATLLENGAITGGC